MSKKYIPLSTIDKLDPDSFNTLLTMPIKILCKNFSTEQQDIKMLNALNEKKHKFWKDKSSMWSFYILEDDILKHSVPQKYIKEFNSFTQNYIGYLSLSYEKRIEALKNNKEKLQRIALKSVKTDKEISKVVVVSTIDTIMINKVIFDDLRKLTHANAKIQSQTAVNETSEIVKITSGLLTECSIGFSIFSEMIERSDGSTMKHMARTFVMTLLFIKYYNQLLNLGYAAKVMGRFNTVYRDKYEKILSIGHNFNLITLERVFKGGMAAIPELEINSIGIGILLHDIGKLVDLEYFEGSKSFVKERIEAHVTNGFNELLNRTVYPSAVSAIAGLHHDYYGDESGYGPLRKFLISKFPNGIPREYFISFLLKDIYRGEAFCYFPAKMLEIVDIYDALTDSARKYRDQLKPEEAIEVIKLKFINENTKIDPILFDMFLLYLIDAGEIAR